MNKNPEVECAPSGLAARTDEDYMRLALKLAGRAAEAGEVPVGAVVVSEGRILARAWNQVELLKDATAHAEMIALTQAENALGNWRLTGATLYVTKEPCVMCAGAMVNARLTRLVYGCPDPRCGAAGSALNVTDFPGMLHRVEVTGGVLADDCLHVLRDFFQERRRAADEAKATGQ
jgi:tRNA(adenine34) deaminase